MHIELNALTHTLRGKAMKNSSAGILIDLCEAFLVPVVPSDGRKKKRRLLNWKQISTATLTTQHTHT